MEIWAWGWHVSEDNVQYTCTYYIIIVRFLCVLELDRSIENLKKWGKIWEKRPLQWKRINHHTLPRALLVNQKGRIGIQPSITAHSFYTFINSATRTLYKVHISTLAQLLYAIVSFNPKKISYLYSWQISFVWDPGIWKFQLIDHNWISNILIINWWILILTLVEFYNLVIPSD